MSKKKDELKKLRHSVAHLVAHAVVELFPNTKLTIGPPTKDGFFYDFLPEHNFRESDMPLIEERMREIVQRDLPMTHEQMSKEQAREIFKDNPFKMELINDIPGDTVGIARQGDFYDLCRGGHVASTGMLAHFKLTGLSGSYWRADKNNQPLQRISGTGFFAAEDLAEYEHKQEEAMKYDHRRLGKQLDLFSFHEEGPGFPFFHAKGQFVINTLRKLLRSHLDEAGYDEIATPTMLSDELWKQSGHYQHYKDGMYFCEIDEKSYALKPMNCPGAILIYRERPHSFRELPIRLSEFGHVHRYELSGVLHGMFRARAFTIDDGHIFCTREQIADEVYASIVMNHKVLQKFNFANLSIRVATRPEKAMGDDALWDVATDALKNGLERAGLEYTVAEGDGAFYGPKIEFHILDSMGRSWQCGTVQLDFFLPENFDLTYVASGGAKERPVMIHRAIFGSFERFFAIVLEHFKGKLPLWLAPTQMRVLTITDEQTAYAQKVTEQLKQHGLRVVCDASSDQISAKIKEAQLDYVPWMLVVGNKEMAQDTVTLRYLDGKQEFGLRVDDVVSKAQALL